MSGPSPIGHGELGGQHHLVALALQGDAHHLLGLALAAVDVGGVEEGDAVLDGGVDHRVGGGLVDAHAEVVAAEADLTDLQAAVAQSAIVHL